MLPEYSKAYKKPNAASNMALGFGYIRTEKRSNEPNQLLLTSKVTEWLLQKLGRECDFKILPIFGNFVRNNTIHLFTSGNVAIKDTLV